MLNSEQEISPKRELSSEIVGFNPILTKKKLIDSIDIYVYQFKFQNSYQTWNKNRENLSYLSFSDRQTGKKTTINLLNLSFPREMWGLFRNV